jgi:hypothetical protein
MSIRMQPPTTMHSPSPVYQRRAFSTEEPPLRHSRLSAIEKGFQQGDVSSDAEGMSPMYDHRVIFPHSTTPGRSAQKLLVLCLAAFAVWSWLPVIVWVGHRIDVRALTSTGALPEARREGALPRRWPL